MSTRRAPIVLSATALGLAATLGFHAHRPTMATPLAAASSSSSGGSSSSASSSSSGAPSSSSSVKTTKTATSATESTPYGPVQLKVTLSNGKVTDVQPVQLPSGDPRSQQINAYAAPVLRQSALSKTNGTVDAVSGATFTSNGYAAALQSALDQTGTSGSASTSAPGY